MIVVITGGAGYVGAAMAVALATRGHRAILVDSDEKRLALLAAYPFPHGTVEFSHRGLEELAGDSALLAEAAAVIHLAGISSDADAEENPERTWRVNLELAVLVARAAKDAGVSKFMLASTAAICQVPVAHRLEHEIFREDDQPPLGQPVGVYAQSKLAAERAVIQLSDSQFAVIVLRKGSLYGYSPVMRWDLFINRMALTGWLGRELLLHDFGAVWRPIAHVEDAARAYLHLLELPAWSTGGLVFNLVERNARLSEVCLEIDDILRGELGRGITLRHGDTPRQQRTGRVSGESLRRTGWHPSRSLRDGIAEILRRLEKREIDLPEKVASDARA